MKLGINQLLVLKRALHRHITGGDVKAVYGFSDQKRYYRKSTQKAHVVLEKLEIYGLIVKSQRKPYLTWALTDRGREILIENLPKSHNQHVGAS